MVRKASLAVVTWPLTGDDCDFAAILQRFCKERRQAASGEQEARAIAIFIEREGLVVSYSNASSIINSIKS